MSKDAKASFAKQFLMWFNAAESKNMHGNSVTL